MRAFIGAIVAPALLLVLAACGSDGGQAPVSSAPAGIATVKVADTELGSILVDESGRTLYAFTKDKNQSSNCGEACIAELLASASGDGVRLRTPRVPEVMRLLAAAGGTVTTNGPNLLTVTGLDAARVAELTAARGLPLHELTPQRATLEQAFMQLTRDAVEFGDQRVS